MKRTQKNTLADDLTSKSTIHTLNKRKYTEHESRGLINNPISNVHTSAKRCVNKVQQNIYHILTKLFRI